MRRLSVLAVLVVSVLAGCAAVPGLSGTGPCADLSTAGDEYDRATVTVSATNGTTLATVDARVADTPRERCVGLSDTASLGPDEGMVFVFGGVADRTFVMRDMAFPLDIIFVGEDRRVTRVVSAPTEEPPYTGYTARAGVVLEVPRGWAAEHGVGPGARVTVTFPDGETLSFRSKAF